jgi:hypothetical protein
LHRILVLAVAALALASCGKSDDASETNTQGKYAMAANNNNQDAMGSSDNNTSSDSEGVPSDFRLPDFVALFPGAKVISTTNGIGPDNSGGMLTFETGAAPSDVIDFYKNNTASAGLKEKTSTSQASMLVFTAASDDNKRNIEVAANPGDSGNGTRAQVTWIGR